MLSPVLRGSAKLVMSSTTVVVLSLSINVKGSVDIVHLVSIDERGVS